MGPQQASDRRQWDLRTGTGGTASSLIAVVAAVDPMKAKAAGVTIAMTDAADTDVAAVEALVPDADVLQQQQLKQVAGQQLAEETLAPDPLS